MNNIHTNCLFGYMLNLVIRSLLTMYNVFGEEVSNYAFEDKGFSIKFIGKNEK